MADRTPFLSRLRRRATRAALAIGLLSGALQGFVPGGAHAQSSNQANFWVVEGAATMARLVDTSPVDGETNVAVAREMVLRFSQPLTDWSVNAGSIRARYGGEDLPMNRYLSFDRTQVTLFWRRNLPDSAQVEVLIDGDLLLNALGIAVDADGDGKPGGLERVVFDTLSLTSVPDTSVVGRVFASELLAPRGLRTATVNRPLANVTIFVQGAENRITTTTDSTGNFRLENVPAGDFFVYIDGRSVATTPDGAPTSVPAGPYYPFVGKKWTSAAGRETSIGDVYLPLVAAGTLKIVSNTEDTTVTMPASLLANYPEYAGVKVIVPAGSLFGDDTLHGGRVGLAPVAPERIPSPLPEGLNLPIVITVQTDGPSNFDVPVPVCFPNVDNPNTAEDEKLAPGTRSALWSFDHDLGDWDIVGTMTVSADGTLICSDEGVGIREPGWHGTTPAGRNKPKNPPKRDDPKPDKPPPCEPDSGEDQPDDLSEDAQSLVQAGIECMRGVRQAERVTLCRYQANRSLDGVMNAGVGLFESLMNDPTTTRRQYQEACNSFGARLRLHFKEASDCGDFGAAVQKLRDAADCLDAVAAAAEPTCNKARNQAGGRCAAPTGATESCNALDNAKQRGDEFRRRADNSEQYNQRAIDDRETLDQLATDLCNRASARGARLDLDSPLTEQERTEIRTQLDAVVAAAGVLGEDYLQEGAVFEPYDQLWRELARANALSADALDLFNNRAVPTRRHYLLEYANVKRRFVFPGPESGIFLPGDVQYDLVWYDPATNELGYSVGVTAPVGESLDLEPTAGYPAQDPDSDGDGLTDIAEDVVGTNPARTDTDGDGVTDAEEVRQGTNPADGAALATGIVASVDTPGDARDVVAQNNLLAVADGSEGITLFNVFEGLTPRRIGQILTPEPAERLALEGNVLAVACGAAGVQLINIAEPTSLSIYAEIPLAALRAPATSVAIAGGLVYAGGEGSEGRLVVASAATGLVVSTREFPAGVSPIEIAVLGDRIAVMLSTKELVLYDAFDGTWRERSRTVAATYGPSRISGDDQLAYPSTYDGYSVLNITNPASPTLLGSPGLLENGFRQLALNGSGIGVAPVAVANPYAIADINIYDTRNPAVTNNYLETFETPGDARAVAIYNGLAYVADGSAGLQVINYLSRDTAGTSPTIALEAPATVSERTAFRVKARVADDVQVRQVEFYRNGSRVLVDGGYPFEWRDVAPLVAATSEFRVRARAFDTGGNSTWSDELVIAVTPDAIAPVVAGVSPPDRSLNGNTDSVAIFFNEPIAATSLDGSFSLKSAGADRVAGTSDDVELEFPSTAITASGNVVTVALGEPLPENTYTARIAAPVADLNGNVLATPTTWSFSVFDVGVDTDGDCLPDVVEALLGLNPAVRDTDNNGTEDGATDTDFDGIPNCTEVLLGFDPAKQDSDDDGILDVNEDRDGDLLADLDEQSRGTSRTNPDSDGDGFADGEEVLDGSNPLDGASFPARRAEIAPHAVSGLFMPLNLARIAADPRLLQHSVSPAALILNEGRTAETLAPIPHAVSPAHVIENTVTP